MPEEKKEQVLLSGDGAGLTDEVLKELKQKYGLTIRVRSQSGAVDKILGDMSKFGFEYDRSGGGGHDKHYDRAGQ